MDDGFAEYGAYIICAYDVSDMNPVPDRKALNMIQLMKSQTAYVSAAVRLEGDRQLTGHQGQHNL